MRKNKMAVNRKLFAFGIVVGATILSITFCLTLPPSTLSWTTPIFRVPSGLPNTIVAQSFKQSIIKTDEDKLVADSDSILLAMRNERRHFILRAREQGVNLIAGGAFYRLFPPSFTCPYKKERLGGDKYGKWACGIRELYGVNKNDLQQTTLIPNCVMYSFGVGPEVDFDEAVLKITNCKVFAYDHTVRNGIPSKTSESKDPRRMAYQKIGVMEYDTKNTTYLKTIKQLMTINGHDWIDILKVDVEGAEYGSLSMLMDDFEDEGGILPFDQLLVEVHVQQKGNLYNTVIPWFNRLEAMGLRAVHAEKNPNCVCFEYDFVNVRGTLFRNSTFSFFEHGWTDMRQYTGSSTNVPLPFQNV